MAALPTPLARFQQLFGGISGRCAVIGMIHVKALPGAPLNSNSSSINEIVGHAVDEARCYRESGVDGLLVENMHDVPYTLRDCPAVTACMTRVCQSVRDCVGPNLPCGLQILAAQNHAALAVAAATNFNFIRAEGFVFSHVADEGLMNACAGELLRYRKSLGDFAADVAIFCDIKKKHAAHSITSDVGIAEMARNADFFRADGLIVTGGSTGVEPDVREVDDVVRAVPHQPVILGSGVTIDNVERLTKSCHGVIVGSSFKRSGHWADTLDRNRVLAFMRRVKKLDK